MNEPLTSPGTVSKILWHFTGGPKWKAKDKRQGEIRKSDAIAYRNLKVILESRELRVGRYRELTRAIVPIRRLDKRLMSKEVGSAQRELQSCPVCCLADIPAGHLAYHAYRYGKFAIGFHRKAAVLQGFHPVLYSLERTPIMQSVFEALSALEDIPDSDRGFLV